MYVQQNSSQMVDQMIGTYGGYFALNARWDGQNFDTFNVSDNWAGSAYNRAFNTIYANYFKIEQITEGRGHYFAFAKLLKAASMARSRYSRPDSLLSGAGRRHDRGIRFR